MINLAREDDQRSEKIAELGRRLVTAGEALKTLVIDSAGSSRKIVELQEEIEAIREYLYELRFSSDRSLGGSIGI
jgi:hypothetical protein